MGSSLAEIASPAGRGPGGSSRHGHTAHPPDWRRRKPRSGFEGVDVRVSQFPGLVRGVLPVVGRSVARGRGAQRGIPEAGVPQDLPNHVALGRFDESQNPKLAATIWTRRRVHVVDPLRIKGGRQLPPACQWKRGTVTGFGRGIWPPGIADCPLFTYLPYLSALS